MKEDESENERNNTAWRGGGGGGRFNEELWEFFCEYKVVIKKYKHDFK